MENCGLLRQRQTDRLTNKQTNREITSLQHYSYVAQVFGKPCDCTTVLRAEDLLPMRDTKGKKGERHDYLPNWRTSCNLANINFSISNYKCPYPHTQQKHTKETNKTFFHHKNFSSSPLISIVPSCNVSFPPFSKSSTSPIFLMI